MRQPGKQLQPAQAIQHGEPGRGGAGQNDGGPDHEPGHGDQSALRELVLRIHVPAGRGAGYSGQGGDTGFFAGFGATAVRDAPYAGLYVLFYEQAKTRLSGLAHLTAQKDTGMGVAEVTGSSSATTAAAINFASGTMAAVGATSVTNPFDAIKTRLQLMPARYGNMIKAARIMLLEDGFRSFFDGLALRMGRKAISSALAWTVYEEIIRRAEKKLSE
ncbi:hypothetical protein H2203_003260 [Taxawa tesnikishii (nom. ined.)]|nr:hypothetical protein H2203_003260 [Dothideales sp. JES 119]